MKRKGRKLEEIDLWVGEQWAVALEKEGKDTVEVPLTSMPEEWQGGDGNKKERATLWARKVSITNVREHPEKKEKDLSLQLLCIFLLSNGTIKSDTFLSIYKSCIEPRTQAVFSLTWSKLHGKHPWPTASLQCKNLSVLCSSPGLFLQKTSKQRRAKVVFYRLVEHVLHSWRVLRKFISWRIMRITLLSVCKG